MRTTVRLDPHLLAEVKRVAASSGRTLTSVIEDALRSWMKSYMWMRPTGALVRFFYHGHEHQEREGRTIG
jgi:metal-responsive CopG/Arc/MetJ family transcriptional regulator